MKKILCVLMVLGVAPFFFVEAMLGQAVRVQESRTASGVSRTSSISGPRMVKFSGTLKDANGLPLTGMVGVTFSLYANEQGGAPLWVENQNVQLDEQGNYAVLLGSTTASGLTVELFASTEPRWLGVQSQSLDAQSRILLNGRVSLPEDWTDHTVVFSKPADPQTASQLSHDPRYLKQQYGRSLAGSRNPNVANPAAAADAKGGGKKNPPPPGTPAGDWNLSLGPSGSSKLAPNAFPAKYNFDINQAPSCTQDFVVFAENVKGGQAAPASQTGTFSSNYGTGSVVVNGTTLTASAGTKATGASTLITLTPTSANFGQSIAVNGFTLTASTPTKETATLSFSGSPTENNPAVTIGGVQYQFQNSGTVSAPNGNGKCAVRTDTAAIAAANLANAISGTGGSSSTWVCTGPSDFPNSLAVVTSGTANPILLQAVNFGSTGFALTSFPLSTLTESHVSGTDGSNAGSNFQIWSGAAGVSAATLGTNIAAAITRNSASTLATASGTTTVAVTAVNSGIAGNSITLSSGLTGFTWAGAGTLTGGAEGTNTTTFFSTTTDTTTEAANLAAAINRTAAISAAVTATSSFNQVTVTANTSGSAGNLIGTTPTTTNTTNFTWVAATLAGGVDPQPSILAVNQLYTGAATTASATGIFATPTTISGGQTLTISNPGLPSGANNPLTLTASAPVAASRTGSFAVRPTSTTATIVAGTITLKTNATFATVTSNTFGTTIVAPQTVTITNGSTLTLTATDPVKATGTLTFGASNPTSDISGAHSRVTVGGSTYRFLSSLSGCSAGFVLIGATPGATADNLKRAINLDGTTGTNYCTGTVLNSNVSATVSGSVVTVTAKLAGSTGNTLAMTLDTAANTGITLSGSTLGTGVGVTVGSDGDNTGTNFSYWSGSSRMTNVQLATNVKAAINRSGNGSSVGVSADASTTASNAIVTATTLGSDSTFTVGGTAAGITWPGVTAGTNGTNACPLLSTATFATSSDTSTLALNLKTAINACSGASVTASNSTNTVTVTAVTAGIGANSAVTTPTTVNATGFNWEGGTLTGGSDGDNTGTNFRYWSVSARVSNVVLAGYVATAINAGGNGSSVGVSASAVSTNVLTVTATASGYAGNSITLGGSASGFTWANPTLFGGTIAGTCTGPAVTWSYDTHTGAGGPVTTSPVLSLDGTKVAFVESLSTGSVLHILRPKTDAINGIGTEGTVGVPVVPSTVTSDGTTFNNCVATSASCMFNLTYTTAANTNSSPYYVYFDDILYLGDDNGKLVKITDVFNGTPAVAWTATVNSTANTKVTSPVVDYSTGKIFVGDSTGKISSVTSSGTATGITGSLSSMTDGPILDGSTGKLHFFGLSSTTPKVVQTDTSLSTPVVATIGGTGTAQIHAGTFDNTYYNSPGGTGTLYVCGHVSTTANTPTLYSIALTSGTMAVGTTGSLALGTGTGECSPLTEINNSGQNTDWLFVGIPQSCAFGVGTASGCVESFNITSGFPATAAAAFASSGGTSGIVVDNVSTEGHASSLYYSTLGVAPCTGGSLGGCAVQVTQAGLK